MSRTQAKRHCLELEGPSEVVIVADSHSRMHPQAVEYIALVNPALILHAGDIGDLSVLDELGAIAPTMAVRGNIDSHDAGPDDLVVDLEWGRRHLRIFMTHIAVYGAKLQKQVRQKAAREHAELVVCGHSHVPLIAEQNSMVVFNPGSLGPRRFQLPITFGVLTVANGSSRLRHVDCETGETWTPPSFVA